MQKELTIIIPTYKKPKSLDRLLHSIELNTDPLLTDVIIISDDGGLAHVKWKNVVCGNGTGAIMAIWKGVLMANTKWIGVLGDDCEITTKGIDKMITKAPENMVIGLNDGIQGGRAHPFMSKEYWMSGHGFPPCYRHYFADTEIFTIAKHHKKWHQIRRAEIIHHHEYSAKKGLKVDIIEENKDISKQLAKYDGVLHENRFDWWKDNGKPTRIPWNII